MISYRKNVTIYELGKINLIYAILTAMLCLIIHTSKCLFLFWQIVVLTYMGAELKDEWSFKDIGVLPGATIRIGEKEEKRPRLYVNCSFNNDRVRGEISSILTLTLTIYSFLFWLMQSTQETKWNTFQHQNCWEVTGCLKMSRRI